MCSFVTTSQKRAGCSSSHSAGTSTPKEREGSAYSDAADALVDAAASTATKVKQDIQAAELKKPPDKAALSPNLTAARTVSAEVTKLSEEARKSAEAVRNAVELSNSQTARTQLPQVQNASDQVKAKAEEAEKAINSYLEEKWAATMTSP